MGVNLEPSAVARLEELGWNDHFASALAALGDSALMPARVSADFGTQFMVESGTGAFAAALSGPLRQAGRPVTVGDWVGIRQDPGLAQICQVLPRRTAISRKAPDTEADAQLLAANVDLVLLATAVGPDFNARRVERFLTVVYQSGASPVILLTKADLDDVGPYQSQLAGIALGVPVVAVSGLRGDGVADVRAQLHRGKTAVLVGSSGVGKSTLINRLLGSDTLRTSEVHRSGQGRHTTSHRQLIALPGAGLIIDTPGLREIQLWAGGDALAETFADVEGLSRSCRFNDCQHQQEPGCAVVAAEADGSLDPLRLRSYRKLQLELLAIEVRAAKVKVKRGWK